MRPIHCLPLAAAILLAACGGGADDLAADGEVTEDELAAALDDAVRPLPGQYRTAIELIEFDIPGMPEAMKGQMRQLVAGEFAQGNEFCMTPEEAAQNGAREMAESLAEGNCTFSRFSVAGGNLDADMQCADENGVASHVVMAGTMAADSSDVTMDLEQEVAQAGKVRLKMRAQTQRIGDCA